MSNGNTIYEEDSEEWEPPTPPASRPLSFLLPKPTYRPQPHHTYIIQSIHTGRLLALENGRVKLEWSHKLNQQYASWVWNCSTSSHNKTDLQFRNPISGNVLGHTDSGGPESTREVLVCRDRDGGKACSFVVMKCEGEACEMYLRSGNMRRGFFEMCIDESWGGDVRVLRGKEAMAEGWRFFDANQTNWDTE